MERQGQAKGVPVLFDLPFYPSDPQARGQHGHLSLQTPHQEISLALPLPLPSRDQPQASLRTAQGPNPQCLRIQNPYILHSTDKGM